MNVVVIGLNHKTAGIEIREKIAFDGSKLEEALKALKGSSVVKEDVILSTCNRVEIYAAVKGKGSEGIEEIKNFLTSFHKVSRGTLDGVLYTYSGPDAIRHIFRVASSLDSMVIGEPQILGQVKDAFAIAINSKSTGVVLNRLMKKAISVAKRIRSETRIAEAAVSISYAAVELAKKIFEDLSTKTFMLIGAGEMAELAARHLINNGVKDVLVTNRTYERAEELARQLNGKAIRFDEFIQGLLHIDIVICSTGARDYILTKEEMQWIMKERKHKPMFIIDISVPRNIDPGINDLDGVYLYDIDDLKGVIENNIKERGREAEKAEKIIDEEVRTFLRWQDSLTAVPAIVALRNKAEAIRREELEKALRKIGPLDEEKIKAIEYLTTAIVNKLIHSPTVALKSANDDRELIVDAARRLFNLEIEERDEQKG